MPCPNTLTQSNVETNGGGLAAAHPDAASADPSYSARRTSHKLSSGTSDRSNSPISRTDTPLTHHSNIAPQHLFDNATHHAFDSPSLPSFALRQPSPSSSSLNGTGAAHEPSTSSSIPYDQQFSSATSLGSTDALKTRVSELEVINGLFRGRVSELEASQEEARRLQMAAQDAEARVRQELDEALSRERDLRRRIEELELQAGGPDERKAKRVKRNGVDGEEGSLNGDAA